MKTKPYMVDGIDFGNMREVQKLIAGVSPALQRMMDVQLQLMRRFRQAEELVIVTFAARNGIELPTEYTGTERRQKLMKQMEVLCATVAPPLQPDQARIVQESWCVDRRNGKTGFEKTWPRAQLVQEADGLSFTVKLVDDPELEKGTTHG